ncbi:MAG: hypothetical protein QOC60_193 [Frankiaceae bacterium]|nr:hypothetical protein [Frankiaceae bacterium]
MINPTLRDVVTVLHELYDPNWAESWDAVGTVCGDPDQAVRSVLFAVDPVREVVAEAIGGGYDLLVTHHPLLLTPVHGVPASTPKGRVVHDLIRAGVALHVCHTNADVAAHGVSDAMAAALGLTDVRPLVPHAAGTGAGTGAGPGSGRGPGAGQAPGLGRIGDLPQPLSARDFVAHVARSLPATAAGVRAAGDLDRVVQRVAVCGGSGDGLLDDVRRAGVDAYVTADLRHHRVSEALEDGAPLLVDAAHWATEWPWLADAAARLRETLGQRGTTVATSVSSRVTDPWRLHVKENE